MTAPALQHPDIPRNGWSCIGVDDLGWDGPGYDPGTCEYCGNHPIRYVHTLTHPDWPDKLDVGCICAERLCKDYDGRGQETALKHRATRRQRWLTRKWGADAGKQYVTLNDYRKAGVFEHSQGWNWFVGFLRERTYGRHFCPTRDQAKLELFDYLTEHNLI